MENWTICHKAIVLLYVIVAALLGDAALSSWYVLSVLVYMCINLSVYITRSVRLKLILLLASMTLTLASAIIVHPVFILLLPINVFELTSHITRRHELALLPMLAPAVFLPLSTAVLYGLVALLSYIVLSLLKIHTEKVAASRDEIETMQDRIDQLTKRLDGNNEFIRQSEYTFKLEERNRLSQEIHDRIGHSMTWALIQMEASKRLLASDPVKSAELLQNAIGISKDGIESIRRVLHNMKPPTEQLGVNRIRLLIDDLSARHAIRTTLTHEGNIDIVTPLQWKIIMENTKEAMTNTMKYGEATAISVHIQVLGTLIKAEVSDNGKGARNIIKGMGIVGMEERTAGLNGTIIVDGSRGFSVTTLLPHGQ